MKAWVRIDSDVLAHPKFAGITPAGFVAWFKGVAHCRQFRTDGVIGKNVVSTIATSKLRADLGKRGLWRERDDSGVDVHDYDGYQLTEKDWQAKSDAGKAGAKARWSDNTPIAPAIEPASDSHTTAIATDSDPDYDDKNHESVNGKMVVPATAATNADPERSRRAIQGTADALAEAAEGDGIPF